MQRGPPTDEDVEVSKHAPTEPQWAPGITDIYGLTVGAQGCLTGFGAKGGDW